MPQIVDLRKIKKVPKKSKHIKVETKTPIPTKLEWAALEFKKYKKGKRWFVFFVLITLAIILAAILLKNFLFVLATILAAFVVYIYAFRKPRRLKFIISGRGIQINEIIYKFEDLKSFWIFYEPASHAGGPPEIKEISFRSKKMLIPYIKVPLGDQNPAEVRRLLLKFLPEKKQQESIIDNWTRKSGF